MHSWVTQIHTRGFTTLQNSYSDLHKSRKIGDLDLQVKYLQDDKYLQQIQVTWVPISTYKYSCIYIVQFIYNIAEMYKVLASACINILDTYRSCIIIFGLFTFILKHRHNFIIWHSTR